MFQPTPSICRHWSDSSGATAPCPPRPDDFTSIPGIGITAGNRLYRAGIRSYRDLARAEPGCLQRILGEPRPGGSYETWIAEARNLAGAC